MANESKFAHLRTMDLIAMTFKLIHKWETHVDAKKEWTDKFYFSAEAQKLRIQGNNILDEALEARLMLMRRFHGEKKHDAWDWYFGTVNIDKV